MPEHRDSAITTGAKVVSLPGFIDNKQRGAQQEPKQKLETCSCLLKDAATNPENDEDKLLLQNLYD